MSKRILSLALVVMMLAAFVPATLFTASAEGEAYRFKYNFNANATYDVTIDGVTYKATPTYDGCELVNTITNYAQTHGMWKFHEYSGFLGGEYGIHPNRFIVKFGTAANRYLALKLNVPVSGEFEVKLTTSGGISSDYFLLPGDAVISDITTVGEMQGAITLKENTGNETANCGTHTVTAGEYLLVARLNDTGAAGLLALNSLEFATPGAIEFTDTFVGTIDPVSVKEGDSTAATARIYNAYTGDAITEGINLVSANTATATASGTTVTGVKAGTTTLTATVAGCEGRIIPGTVAVTGRPYQFKYTFNSDATYDIPDLGLAAKIQFSSFEDPTSIKDYAMTGGAWKYYGSSGYTKSDYGMNTARVILTYGNSTGRYFAVKLNVPADGTFDVTLESGTSIKSDYFLLPGDTVISDITAIDTVTGAKKLDNDYTPSGVNVTKTYPGIDLKKGEYIFVVRLEDTGASGNVILYDIEMKTSGAAQYKDAYVGTIDPVAVVAGAEAEAKARVYNAYTGEELTSGITLDTKESTIATVSGTTVKGVKGGTTALTATVDGKESNIIPGTVTVTEPGYQFKYTFKQSATCDVTDNGMNLVRTPNATTYYKINSFTDYAMTHGAWKFHGASRAETGSYGLGAYDAIFVFPQSEKNRYVAYDINVPVGGTFDVTLSYVGAAGCATDYFLLPAGTELSDIATADQNPNAKILVENFAGAANSTNNLLPNPVTLEKGEYIFVCRLNDESGSSSILSRIAGLEMKTSGAAQYKDAYVGTIDPISVEEGKTAKANARIYNAYDNTTEYAGDVIFESGNPQTAKVEDGIVTGVKGGTTQLTARLDGAEGNIIPGAVAVAGDAYQFKYTFLPSATCDVTDNGMNLTREKNASDYYMINSFTDYAMTYGAWKFRGVSYTNGYDCGIKLDGVHRFTKGQTGRYIAYDINVPVDGTFDVTLYTQYSNGLETDYFLLPINTDLSQIPTLVEAEDVGGTTLVQNYLPVAGTGKVVPNVDLKKGEYTFVMRLNDETGSGDRYCRISYIEMKTSNAAQWKDAYVGTIDPINIVEGDAATAKARIYNAYDNTELTSGYTFGIEGSSIASLSGANLTNTKEGIAEITATLTDVEGNIVPGKLTVANKALTDAFVDKGNATSYTKGTVSPQAYIKGSDDAAEIKPTATANGNKYNLVAPDAEGYKFLYWVKGLATHKRILSFDAEYTYAPVGGTNVIIAVYEPNDGTEEAKAEFYNPNGQLIATLEAVGKFPALPVIAGKTATHWENARGDKKSADDDFTPGNETEIWVAQYDDEAVTTVTVTAKNASGTKKYAYGELVTLEANGEGTFRYWQKTTSDNKTEIVGFKSKTYSFYAWEDCTVEAVYGESAPIYSGSAMKILIDTFGTDGKNVMAEFIGFNDVTILEKGIILDTDIAMTTDAMQFTIYNTTSKAAKGYAVIEVNGKIYRIEDGE